MTEPTAADKSFFKKNPWIIVPAILIMGSAVFVQLQDMRAEKKASWQQQDTKDMVAQCLLDSKDLAEKYPELTKDYCSCSTQLIQKKFTKEEYTFTLTKPIDEQTKILLPVFQPCLTDYQNKVQALKDK